MGAAPAAGVTRTPGPGGPRPVRVSSEGWDARPWRSARPYYGGAAPSGARVRSSGTAGQTDLRGAASPPGEARPDAREPPGGAEGLGTEKPRRAPGVWRSNKL